MADKIIGGHKHGGILETALYYIYDNDVISKNLAVINMAEFSKTRQIMTVFNIASKVIYTAVKSFVNILGGQC